MVAGASGAHVVAFEPQTPLRSVINLAARLNQISDRIRVLPFAALDKFRKIAMSNYQEGDGGVGFLDYSTQESVIKTQTIRVDSIPSFNRLFDTNSNKLLSLRTPNDFGQDYAAALEKNNKEPNGTMLDKTLAFKQPIHFLKIDVEGFELPALESASGLYEAGLVEHTVLEFGPPSRWDVTIEDGETMSLAEKRAVTLAQAKKILLRAVQEWNLDIYLLPAIGWEATVNWMVQHGVDYRNGGVGDNRAVYRLKAWDFDGKGLEGDEFEAELEAKDQVVTEFIPLPEHLIEPYLESLESIGEMYLWFVKKDNKLPIMTTTEL
ncbi:hypothetical protein J3Q64DRAFT_1321730 [Phycomyces blakesleeanus]|uniref:Methyltransferase FkbM domain-containing protein n=1 Tax=Phycomyces blakesleeanus TaxID=4837 RepID=A0ABR3B6J1_PHYBL